MASSNRHWPSMFKSKPCNSHHQWQHDINPATHIPSCQRPTYASGNEERSPDPKPRWNPKPEQIRILEAIFNSGLVNPPRDEIRRIRVQLQEYGQVGDANVFYWFQNRKSRSKHKQRHSHTSKPQTSSAAVCATTFIAPSSSSSSSEKSPPKRTSNKSFPIGMDASNSPTATYFQTHGDFSTDPFLFPMQQSGNTNNLLSQGLCFPEFVQIPDQVIGPCTGFLLSELLNQNSFRKEEEAKQQQHLTYPMTNTTTIPTSSTNANINQIQGVGGAGGAAKSTVFINNVAFEVALGPFNVREAFGDDAMLIHATGQPVITNEWGLTSHPLQPGAFYYLV